MATEPRPTLVVCGRGYTGSAIAKRWAEAGGNVLWTARTGDRGEGDAIVAAFGHGPIHPPPRVPRGFGVITFGTGQEDPAAAVTQAVDWLADAGIRAIAYLSSTSVYGDCGGEVVTEDRPPAPTTEMGRRRVAVEAAFEDACAGRSVRAVTLRIPGIYGPGRTPRARFVAGAYRFPRGERWSNRVHREDVARAVEHALLTGLDGVFNTSDGRPFQVSEFLHWVAETLDVPPPTAVQFDELSESAKPFWQGNRQISNAKLTATGWSPVFPDVRDGHRQSWAAEDSFSGKASCT